MPTTPPTPPTPPVNQQPIAMGPQPVPVEPTRLNPRYEPNDPAYIAARANLSRQIRIDAADFRWSQTPTAPHVANGDEAEFPSGLANYSKGLVHDEMGVPNADHYKALVHACVTGDPKDFQKIVLNGGDKRNFVKLVNPQSGLAFDMQGADAPSLYMPAALSIKSKERAAEMVELYWMAACRDVPFCMYGKEPYTMAAIAELNSLDAFTGPRDCQTNQVTAATLFRGDTPGELAGPYISQFFLKPAGFGDLAINDPMGNPAQQYGTYMPGLDYMTTVPSWLAVQNGAATMPGSPNAPFGPNVPAGPRYLFNGRAGAAFVHVDELYQAYFMAALNLLDSLKFNSYDQSLPYQPGQDDAMNQAGFGTFGNPHVVTLVAEVATRALKAQWFQKWFVHRTLRPEAFAGLVHFTKKGTAGYPLPANTLDKSVLDSGVFAYLQQNIKEFLPSQPTPTPIDADCMSYLLPMAFPEGSPQHPSYGSGHATVAGACATIIKAFFNESMPIQNPVEAAPDGKSLVPYTGGATLTVAGEANKIAGNVGMFRNHAGVHWRSDHVQSILLGERIAISILADQIHTYNESFPDGWTLTTFDKVKITINQHGTMAV